MYIIIWEYRVKPEHVAEFEETYVANGAWTRLFQKAAGYLGTELLHDPNSAARYITIDHWKSAQDYERFLLQWQAEYSALDAQCEKLTRQEMLLGEWESVTL